MDDFLEPESQEPLAMYERQMRLLSQGMDEATFKEKLAASRAGDDVAIREICGAYLQLVFDLAKRTWQPTCRVSVLDLVQEGNDVLVRTVSLFQADSEQDFVAQLEADVQARLRLMLV